MVLFSISSQVRGLFILTFLGGLLFLNFATADSFTGFSQPLDLPATECSTPPTEISETVESVQIISEFTFRACREYRANKSKTIYYTMETVHDGEYIHMIPAPGATSIAIVDYQLSALNARITCQKIRDSVIDRAIPLKVSRCANP